MEINRQEIKAAIAKAAELRALHSALMQGKNSPAADRRFAAAASPVFRHAPLFSAQDYPVFTPSYEDEPLPGYQQILMKNQSYPENWEDYTLNRANIDETFLSMNLERHICSSQHQTSTPKSGRNSMGDTKSMSSCNKCKPAVIITDSDDLAKNGKKSNVIVPLSNSHSSSHHSQPRNKGLGLSRLFPKLKKKNKDENSSIHSLSEDVSIETLKKELMEANESREAALTEAAEMKSSLLELSQKLKYLQTHCEELKSALAEKSTPVHEEVMVEAFLQIVSESRLSVKQFCKTLVGQIQESDYILVHNLKISLSSRNSKPALYHLEAIINQSLYQDFENCVFQKNGAEKHLDPQKSRQARFQSYIGLRNLSWNEVLKKGTKYYSEEFSKFCDEKMSGIIAMLGWIRPWPEKLLQAFFVAAKCIWLLHLLAFSFDKPLGILRVDEDVVFEGDYMEDALAERRLDGSSRVKIMVMPGFYVLDRVVKCKVVCRYEYVS
ncbi:hypothetical protein BUALT_Bualt13G0031700 [Buddleja alternifolia]|uniref:IRK-interacting protein n=1 Tax=Buddleja alternifolia TaxID=168488 RepID=A0AAV6WR32_9LAMI|nr:hypothetical protein BUALT_Bualt13G0031700 [Buddleja alternifolia]